MSSPYLDAHILLRQQLMTELSSRLVIHAIEQGYQPTFNVNALHCEAVLTLWRDGKRVVDRADYDALGVWWETRHVLCKHGGSKGKAEYRNYSIDTPET